MAAIAEFFDAEAPRNGWQQQHSASASDAIVRQLGYEKDERGLQITLADVDEATSISITTGGK